MKPRAIALALLLAGCTQPGAAGFDGRYPARVAVEGSGRCGASGRNVLLVRRGEALIEMPTTEFRGPVAPDGRLDAMRVFSGHGLETRMAQGQIQGGRFWLEVETFLPAARGTSTCRYRYEGAREDPKGQGEKLPETGVRP